MNIFVIIPTFNRKGHLKKLLIQLREQSAILAGYSVQTIVAMDGSTDGTLEMLHSEFPKVHVVKGDGNWWYTESMNQGFKLAEGLNPDLVLTLNDDVELDTNYLQNICSASAQMKHKAIIGSLSITRTQPHKVFFAGVKHISWVTGSRTRYFDFYESVDLSELTGLHSSKVLPGRGMLIPFTFAKKLGYFDSGFVQYGSDDDFCLRAQQAGHEVFISWDARIYCFDQLTGQGSPKVKQSFFQYAKRAFDPHSPTSIKKDIRLIVRNVNPLLIPIACSFKVAQTLYTYFKYQKGN
ncbi:MAG: glycosyltransferase family 2 protein [Flavobacteriales bacterium]|nr:glycosyltransferase family 2 protein [Flavobacteriales bacterium]